MDASLMEQRRVSEEGFRIVKLCCWVKKDRGSNWPLFDGNQPESHG